MLLDQWNGITNAVATLPRLNIPDRVIWSLNSNNFFSTKSVYQLLEKIYLVLITNGSGKQIFL
jgi:hypothetical protein